MITAYLVELLGELRVSPGKRRRILAEVEDHLACAAAELRAAGRGVQEAECVAVERFGPARELARVFVEQEAAVAGRRLARAAGLLAGVFAVLALGTPWRVLPSGAFTGALLVFVAGQVAMVAGGLTLVRAWRATALGGLCAERLGLVLRGAVVVLGCVTVTVTYETAAVLARGLSGLGGWAATALPALAGLVVGLGVTTARLVVGLRLAKAARAAAEASGQPADSAPIDDYPDPLTDLGAVGGQALERLQLRMPAMRGVTGLVTRLVRARPGELRGHAPRAASWFDRRRHPWRFAVAVALAAGLALAAWHALREGGLTAADLQGQLLGAAVLVTIEGVAALLGFAALGRFLGIRAPDRERLIGTGTREQRR